MELGYDEIIDAALRIVYSQFYRLGQKLSTRPPQVLRIEELRQGLLGQDLRYLADVASQRTAADPDAVHAAIDSVLQALFWPPAPDDFQVPRTFWDTPLGAMLSLAKLHCYSTMDLVGIGEAAHILGVSRPTIYRWMDDATLDYVRDDLSGRIFLIRRSVLDIKKRLDEAKERDKDPGQSRAGGARTTTSSSLVPETQPALRDV
jgi:excisionase family DNA binding protein